MITIDDVNYLVWEMIFLSDVLLLLVFGEKILEKRADRIKEGLEKR